MHLGEFSCNYGRLKWNELWFQTNSKVMSKLIPLSYTISQVSTTAPRPMKKYLDIFERLVRQDYKRNTCSCYKDRCTNTIYDCRISAREVTITTVKCYSEVTGSKNYPPLCTKLFYERTVDASARKCTCNNSFLVRLEVITALFLQIQVFWQVTSRRL